MEDKPITARASQGTIDALSSTGRLLVVVVTSLPILLQLLGTRDLVQIIAYLQGQDGVALVAALVGLGTMAWGIMKSRRRGGQVATVAADPRVPDAVAHLKS